MIPPAVMSIAIKQNSGKGFRLWLPIILLWPVLILVLIIVVPIAALAEVALYSRGIRPFSILIGLLRVIAALKGTLVDVVSRQDGNNATVKIHIY